LKTYVNYLPTLLIFAGYAPTLMSQNIAKGTLDRDRITAGETFSIHINFEEAPTYDGGAVRAWFNYAPTNAVVPESSPNQILCQGVYESQDKRCGVAVVLHSYRPSRGHLQIWAI
jgi:hypothetical protein